MSRKTKSFWLRRALAVSAIALALSVFPTSEVSGAPEICKGDGFAFLITENTRLNCMQYLREGGLYWDAVEDFRFSPNEQNPSPDQHGNSNIWAYMWSPTTERNPDTYLPFTSYWTDPTTSTEGWDVAPTGFPYLAVVTVDTEHLWLGPTVQNMVVVRWRSPFTGHVSFWGQFYPHQDAGDGISWFIQHQHGSAVTTLAEGALDSGGPQYAKKATFGFSSLAVTEDDYLYFAVEAGATDAFDNTIFAVTLIGPYAWD